MYLTLESNHKNELKTGIYFVEEKFQSESGFMMTD